MSSTLCLIRQDPARAGLLRAIVTCVAGGGILRIAPDLGEQITRLNLDDLPGGFVPFYLLLTALVASFVLGGNAWTRSSRLALGLPISTRRVWIVRMGSLIGIALVSVAAFTVLLGLSVDLAQVRFSMNPAIALAGARSAATVVLMLFIFQLPQSARDRIPITAPYVVYVIFSWVFILVFSAFAIPSIAGTVFLSTVAVGLGIYLYLRIPATFSVGPTIEESETPVWSPPDNRDLALPEPLGDVRLFGDRQSSTRALHWVLFRALKTNILTWFLIGIVGASATVATLEFLKGTNALLPLFFLTIYQLPLLQAALESMAPFDPLPIARRVLWAHTAGPIVFAAGAGLLVAGLIFGFNQRSFTHISYSECCVNVPWDYMKLSSDGRVPAITTAWGESYRPRAHPLWKGRTAVLYDPFEIGQDSSSRFAEHQLRRAIEAVYGVGAENKYSSIDATRGRMSADRNRTAAVALIVLAFLTTTLIFFSLLQFGNSIHRKVYKWISIGFIVFVVALAIAVSVARVLGFTEVWYIGALISMGTRSIAHALPLPTPILWFFCVTFWAGAYLLLERVFGTIEFPREKTMNRLAEVY
jgi:hypothetical protein